MFYNDVEENTPIMFKCRTCLKSANLRSGTSISTEFVLGKSIKDILFIFIPRMVTSTLVGELICSECTRQLRYFTDFIENFIKVEKFLIEESIKIQRKIAKEKSNVIGSTLKNSDYLDVSRINQSKIQNDIDHIQPIRQPSVSINHKNNLLSSLKDQSHSDQRHEGEGKQSQFCEKEQNLNNSHSSLPLTNKNKSDGRYKPEGKNLLLNGDVKFYGIGKELTVPDLLSYNGNIMDSNVNVDVSVKNDAVSTAFLKKSDLYNKFKSARKEFCNRIVCVKQAPDQVQPFLNELSQSGMRMINYTPNNTSKKRILFMGISASQCLECKALLNQPKILKIHFRKEHLMFSLPDYDSDDDDSDETKTFQCPFCTTVETTNLSLVQHLRNAHHVRNPFYCEKCGKRFQKREAYTQHMKLYMNSEVCYSRKCRYCQEVMSKDTYQEHLETHRSIICDKCGKNFSNLFNYRAHYRAHNSEYQSEQKRKRSSKSHLCSFCGKLVSNSEGLSLHMKTHSERPRNYICHKCPKTYFSLRFLRSHLANAHTEKKYKCELCDVTVATTSALSSHHRLKHSDSYTHTCKICGKGFSRSDYYRRHTKQHTQSGTKQTSRLGSRKYNYSVKLESKSVSCKFCHKVFKNIYMLRGHILRHMQTRRFKCKFCNMSFANKPTMFRHQKRHADPNFDLSCKVCWHRMETKEDLERHLAKHEETKKYECSVCHELFPSQYLLKDHAFIHVSQEEVEKEKEILLTTGLKDFLL